MVQKIELTAQLDDVLHVHLLTNAGLHQCQTVIETVQKPSVDLFMKGRLQVMKRKLFDFV